MDALALDVNHFHLLNELNGREYGDQVLRQIADSLHSWLQNAHGIASRTTADHFYIYCEHRDSYEDLMQYLLDGIAGLMQSDRVSLRLVEIIMEIARYLSVPIIAEGVETQEQLNRLRKLGCDIVQGYYFSAPVPPEKFEAFIAGEVERERKAGTTAGEYH